MEAKIVGIKIETPIPRTLSDKEYFLVFKPIVWSPD
tara:strand:- start:54 stop:161 length:108 start_codon:yes stop_codon:yes gene_type:complete